MPASAPRLAPRLPQPSVQHDWRSVVAAPPGSFWLSLYSAAPPLHTSIAVTLAPDSTPCLVSSESLVVTNLESSHDLHISCPNHNYQGIVTSPRNTFRDFAPLDINVRPKASTLHFNSIDISPRGELGVIGCDDGKVVVFETANGTMRREFASHLSDVLVAKFFPSSEVLLTGGSDFVLKITSALDGDCPMTLKGHSGGILDAGIIERGRNVVSSARDGKCLLWDVPTGTIISTLASVNSAINSLSLGYDPTLTAVTPNLDSREVGTTGKIALFGSSDGVANLIDIGSKTKIGNLLHSTTSSVEACTVTPSSALLGTSDGELLAYDLRNLTKPIASGSRAHGVVSIISDENSAGFIASFADGTAAHFQISSNHELTSSREFLGMDHFDSGKCCLSRANGGGLWVATRSGLLMQYR